MKQLVTGSLGTRSGALFTQRPQWRPLIHTRRRNDAPARRWWRMPLTLSTMALMTRETCIKPRVLRSSSLSSPAASNGGWHQRSLMRTFNPAPANLAAIIGEIRLQPGRHGQRRLETCLERRKRNEASGNPGSEVVASRGATSKSEFAVFPANCCD